uniref:Cell surface protein n=1 Tax=uncultured bacterium contig00003 TaxID=1181495 RepID=A0A806JYC0_9BACT|nr:cell surface protein [uncultured bacterium contig00003]
MIFTACTESEPEPEEELPVTYAVTVVSGTGSGDYEEGETVFITADAAPQFQQFKNWTTSSAGVTFANANSDTTTFTMPANNVTVTANYELAPLTSISAVTTYLTAQSGGSTAANPISLKVNMALGTPGNAGSEFRNLLAAIDTAEKFVELDLGSSTMIGTAFTTGTTSGTPVTGGLRVVSINLPSTATSITSTAFRNWTSLKSASGTGITATVGSGLYGVLEGCTALTSVNFPELVTLGSYTFWGCTSLASVNIPKVASITGSAFYNCGSVTNIIIAGGLSTSAFGSTSLSARVSSFRTYYLENTQAGRVETYAYDGSAWTGPTTN